MLTDLALGTASSAAKKAILPWLFLVLVLVLGATGAAGMYAGYEIAAARHAQDREQMLLGYVDAANAQKEALKEARQRGDDASARFIEELRGIKIVNTTINKEVRKETQKLVYTDCKLPDSGADLLQRHVNAVNLKLLESDK